MSSIYRVLPLVALAALVFAQSVPQAPISVSVSYSPPYVYPGSVLQLYITVFSPQSLTYVYVDVDSPFKVLTGTTMQIPKLAANMPTTLTAVVQVPLDAKPGSYRVKVTAYTLFTSAETSVDFEVLPFDFSSLVVAVPSSYVAGQPAQLPVLVINPTLDFLRVNINATGGVVENYLNRSTACDVTVAPRGNATCFIVFKVAGGARPGFYNVTLSAQLRSLSGYAGSVSVKKVVQLPVVSAPDVNIVATPAQPPVAGTPTVLTLYVTPGSAGVLQNVTIKVLDGDGVRVLSGGFAVVPVLTQLQLPVQVVFYKYGDVPLPVEICLYSDTCTTRLVSVYVPTPQVVVNAVFNPPRGYPGSIVQATFIAASNYTASDVAVEVHAPFELLSLTPTRIPFLTPQSPATITAVFEIPSSTRPGLYPVAVRVGNANYTFYYEVKPQEFTVSMAFNPPISYPGGLVTGTATVVSPFTASNLTIRISTPLKPLCNAEVNVPVLPQGQPFTIPCVFQIPEDAQPGEYPVAVAVGDANYTFYLTVGAPTVAVQNVLATPPRVLKGVPVVQVAVQLINTGPVAARDVVVQLLNGTVGPRVFRIDFLPPGSSTTLTFLLDASKLQPGLYSAVVDVKWSGGEARGSGSFEVVEKSTFKVEYVVLNAQPGSTATLLLNLTNVGPYEAKNVRLVMTPSQVFEPHASNIADVATATSRVLGDLEPGSSASTAFLLDVSDKAAPGRYYITFVVTWNQTNAFGPAVQYITVPVEVRGGLDLFVVVPAALTVVLILVGVAIALRRRRRG